MITGVSEMIYAGERWFLSGMLVILVLSATRLWRLAQREALQRRRMEAFRGTVAISRQETRPAWYRKLARIVALSPIVGKVEQQRMAKLLVLAGLKGQASLVNFIAMKICSAAIVAGLAWIGIEWEQLFDHDEILYWVLAIGAALLVGWRLPDMVLHHLIRRRKIRLEAGIPDALDLLVVCSEAGLSLNQAIDEVSRQLVASNKDAADEFAITSAEMRVISDFSVALDNLVERTGLDDLRSLVATLKQSMKFGTSLAESLRLIASEMRAARQARMEERAARLPVLLAVPMLIFILPCLMMVVGTPVILRMLDAFKGTVFGGL